MARNTVTMQLTGIEALQRALQKAPDVVTAHVTDVIMTTTFGIEQRAKALVPVASGALKRAIASNAGSRAVTGRVGLSDPKLYYWRFVEFGTVKMSARPFFRPAFDQEEALVNQRLQAAARKVEHGLSGVGGRFL